MQYRTLGRTGVQVSALGLGTNQFGRVVDGPGATAIVERALELGVNFIDTAESYSNGASETLLGSALAGRRHEVVLATKTGAGREAGRLTRKQIAERLDASLGRLGTDYIDLYYLHMPDPATPLEESLRVLEEAVRSGKIRYAGVSNHAAWQVAEAIGLAKLHDWSPIVASQMEHSLVERSVEREMIPACEQLGVSLVPYFPLAGGFLTGKYERNVAPPPDTRFGRAPQRSRYLTDGNFDLLARAAAFARGRGRAVGELAIAWLLAHPVVCSVIAGAVSPDQVASNAKATEWTLSLDEVTDV